MTTANKLLDKTDKVVNFCVCENCGSQSNAEPLLRPKKGEDEPTTPQQKLYIRARILQHQEWRIQAGQLLCGTCAVEWEKMKRLAMGY